MDTNGIARVESYEFGPYRLIVRDNNQILPCILFKGDREVKIIGRSAQLGRLLLYLLEHREGPVGTDIVIKHVWPGDDALDRSRNLNEALGNLRTILGDKATPRRYIERSGDKIQFIHTVRTSVQSLATSKNVSLDNGANQPADDDVRDTVKSPQSFRELLADVEHSVQHGRWDQVERAASTFGLTFDEKCMLFSRRQALVAPAALRLAALVHTGQFENATKEINSHPDFEMSFPGETLPYAIGLGFVAYERIGDKVAASRLLERMWELTRDANPEQLCCVLRHSLGAADLLSEYPPMEEPSMLLLDGITSRLTYCADVAQRLLLARASLNKIDRLMASGRAVEALAAFDILNRDTEGEGNEVILGSFVWAAFRAVKALRLLARPQQAEALAISVNARFRNSQPSEIKFPLARILIDRLEETAEEGEYMKAADQCSEFIDQVEPGADNSSLVERALAYVYARRSRYLRGAGKYDLAIQAAEQVYARFSQAENVYIRQELIFGMRQKSIALRYCKRFGESIAEARSIVARFDNSSDQPVISAYSRSIHDEGDTLVAQSKALLQLGLTEDATTKLREARDCFIRAETRFSNANNLLCQAYAEFLLGDKNLCERTFKRALELLSAGGLPLIDDKWFSTSIFPLPDDIDFQALANRLKGEYLSNRSSAK